MISFLPIARGQRRVPLLALAALLFSAPAAAQQTRGFTLEEVEELLRNEVASDRVLLLVQQRCIDFVPDNAAIKRVVAAGGSEALVAGLRGPGQCSTVPRTPAPVARPDSASPPPPPATPAKRVHTAFTLSYVQGTFRPDGSSENNEGQGASLAVEIAARFGGVFLEAGFVDVQPQEADDYSRGTWDGGVRLSPAPRGWPVRPYVDAGVSFSEISYYDDDGIETVRALRGWGLSGAAGVRVGLSRKLSVDLAYRRLSTKFDREEVLGETNRLDEPIRGTGSRWLAGLTWGG